MSIKFEKSDRLTLGEKKSARNTSKVLGNTNKSSKLVSARDKKRKKNQFIEELK